MEITQEYLKSILEYDSATGLFTWKVRTGNGLQVGDEAGVIDKLGYRRIRIKGKPYYASRLAWLYVYGAFPDKHVDHMDGNKSNNCISNLRSVTHRENLQNLARHRDGHLPGVTWDRHIKRWIAKIRVDGQRVYLGCYLTQDEAYRAYCKEHYKQLGCYPLRATK